MSIINDLNVFRKNIKNIINLFLAFTVIISLGFYTFIFYTNRQLNKNTYKILVNEINKHFQSIVSAQLVIIANDPIFISYLRSGEITREKYFSTIRWIFSNFDNKLINGIDIFDNQQQIIFSYGKKTNFYTKLDLCYLGEKFNPNLGICTHSIIIYFDENGYLNQLHKLEPHLITGTKQDNYLYQPFSSQFGMFHSSNHSENNPLELQIYYEDKKSILISVIFGLIFLLIILVTISQRYLKVLIEKKLINPIKYITDSLNTGDTGLIKDGNFLLEFNKLIDVVKKHNSREIYAKLEMVAGEMAHKLNNPISGIRTILPRLKLQGSSNAEIELLERYINKIYGMTSSVLENFRESTSDLAPEENISIPRFILIENLTKTIFDDFKSHKNNCEYIFEATDESWVYISLLEFEDCLVNLLNNAYESLTNTRKQISIRIENIKNTVNIYISDTGHGIPKKEISRVKKGKSLKHKGKGIGLSTAIEYFNNIHGSLDLESKEKLGTTISISIPINVPKWIENKFTYNDKTVFIILDYDISTITDFQNILISLDNRKIYFTTLESYYQYLKENSIQNISLIINDSFYPAVMSHKINKEIRRVYIVCDSVPTYGTQNLLLSNNHNVIFKSKLSTLLIKYLDF